MTRSLGWDCLLVFHVNCVETTSGCRMKAINNRIQKTVHEADMDPLGIVYLEAL